MHVILTALVCFGILTLWIPAYWPVTLFQVGVFALAATVLLRRHDRLPGLTYPYAALGLAVILGVTQWLAGWTVYPFVTQTATVQWATFLAIYLTGACLFTDERISRWFRAALVWFSFIVAVVATLQTFSSQGKVFWLFPSGYPDGVMGPILSRNHYAAFIEAVLPIAVFQALASERDSLLYSAMAGAMYASVIASASRAGSVLASAEILAVIGLMWARGRTSRRTIGLSLLRAAILFAAFTGVVGWETVWKRFWEPDSIAVRPELAIATLRMITAHPWFGVGLGAWSTVYPHYAVVDIGAFANQAHNDWLQWTAEGGIPFGLLMAGLFFWCLRPAFRTVWGLGAIAVLLHALVDYPFSRPALGSWTILLVAMMAATPQRESRRPGSRLRTRASAQASAPQEQSLFAPREQAGEYTN